ncbi:hypothetical protein ANN_16780 [Periplaneta americana]|uniref:Uncharacterized protein n=1 Tax=Periplaneta americana TaxID=6978 RepID=A0ABQ8SR27_PERAM|nr:hypothetical protein ANN_16780 [Periplaneta americana]
MLLQEIFHPTAQFLEPQVLQDGIINYVAFQHDGAPCHYAAIIQNYLNDQFPNRWIGRRAAADVPTGVEVLLFLELARRLGFSWRLDVFPEHSLWWERSNDSDFGGVALTLASGRADVAFGSLWVALNHEDAVDFSVPWTLQCTTFLVPHTLPAFALFRRLTTPFQGLVWWTLLIVVVVTALTVCALFYCRQRCMVRDSGRRVQHLHTGEHQSLLRALYHNTPWWLRWLWFMFWLVVTTAYSSSLVSHLTAPAPGAPLDSIQDLVAAQIFWGYGFQLPMEQLFDLQICASLLQNPWHSKFVSRFQVESSPEEKQQRIGRHDYAVLVRKLGDSNYVMGAEVLDQHSLGSLRLMKGCVIKHYLCFGLKKRSPLKAFFNDVLGQLMASGLPIYWQRRTKATALLFDADLRAQRGVPEPLLLSNLQDAFALLALGHVLSLAAFFVEQLAHTRRKKGV